jgi:hypothetical protein
MYVMRGEGWAARVECTSLPDARVGHQVMRVPLEARRNGEWVPVCITTDTVRAQTGQLGAVGRALMVSGLFAESPGEPLERSGLRMTTTSVTWDPTAISLLALALIHQRALKQVGFHLT